MDTNKLTLGEVEDIEEITGCSLAGLFAKPEEIPAKAIAAVVYIIRRRTDPTATLENTRAMDYETILEIFAAGPAPKAPPAPPATLAPPAPPATPQSSDGTSSSASATSTDGQPPRSEP